MNAIMHAVVHAVGIALVAFVWQGAILGLIAASLLTLLRNARSQTRYAVACMALLFCAVLPLWTFAVHFGRAEDAATFDLTMDAMRDVDTSSISLATVSAWMQTHLTSVVTTWAICVVLLGLRMGYGLVWVARVSSKNRSNDNLYWQTQIDTLAARMGIRRELSLRVVQGLETPATVGWWRPVIMVPAALICGMPPDLLEALLAHEIAHVHRFDYLVNLMQSVVEAVLFYHPAVWWISHRMRVEREHVADNLATEILGEPRRLALALRELDHIQFTNHQLAQAAHGGNLTARIKRLIHPEVQPLDWKAVIPAIGLVVAGIAFCANAALADTTVSVPARTANAQTSSASFLDPRACRPQYPRESMMHSEEGSVRVAFEVDADGRLLSSRIVRSSGHPLLDNATLTGFNKCSFKAAMKDGKPVASSLTVDYVWKLGL